MQGFVSPCFGSCWGINGLCSTALSLPVTAAVPAGFGGSSSSLSSLQVEPPGFAALVPWVCECSENTGKGC